MAVVKFSAINIKAIEVCPSTPRIKMFKKSLLSTLHFLSSKNIKGRRITHTKMYLYIKNIIGDIELSPSLITGPAIAQHIVVPNNAK